MLNAAEVSIHITQATQDHRNVTEMEEDRFVHRRVGSVSEDSIVPLQERVGRVQHSRCQVYVCEPARARGQGQEPL